MADGVFRMILKLISCNALFDDTFASGQNQDKKHHPPLQCFCISGVV